MRRHIVSIAGLIAAIAALVSCSDDDTPATVSQSPAIFRHFELTDYRFDPTTFTGFGTIDPITFELNNSSTNEHTFTVDALDIDTVIPAGDTALVSFSAETGDFEFYCRFHKDLGMRGSFSWEAVDS